MKISGHKNPVEWAKALLGCLIIIVGLPICCGSCIWLGTFVFDRPKSTAVAISPSPSHPQQPEQVGVKKYELTVDQLLAEFKADKEAAIVKYRGSWVQVSGRVDFVTKDGRVWMSNDKKKGLPGFSCYFADAAKARALSDGQDAVIVGQFEPVYELNGAYFNLRECAVVQGK